jgi:hypothetical protein
MTRNPVLRILPFALATLLLAALVDDASAQLLGNSPMSSVVAKTNETRQMLVTIGKAAVGVIAAVLFLMALGGRVAWHWVIMVVVAGAGLTGLDSIVAWINS